MTNILCIFVVFVCFVCSGHSEVANDEQNSLTNIRNRRQIIYYRPIVGYYPQRIQYVNNPYYYGSNYYPQYSAWDLSSRKRREAIPSRHEHDADIGFGSSDFIREDTNFDAIDQPNDDTSNTHRMKRQVKVVSDANDNNVDDSEASARSKQDSHFNWQRQTLWDLSRRKRQTNQDSDNNENNADDSKGNSRNKHDSKHFHQRYSMWDLSRRKRQINQVADNNDKTPMIQRAMLAPNRTHKTLDSCTPIGIFPERSDKPTDMPDQAKEFFHITPNGIYRRKSVKHLKTKKKHLFIF